MIETDLLSLVPPHEQISPLRIPAGKKIIVVAGEIKSGKDEFTTQGVDFYQSRDLCVEKRSTSQWLKELANENFAEPILRGLSLRGPLLEHGELTREALLHFGFALQKEFGEDCLTYSLLLSASKRLQLDSPRLDVFILNGIRRAKEAMLIHHWNLPFVWVHSTYELCRDREKKYGQIKDPVLFRERYLEEQKELITVKFLSDYRIDNTGTIDELREQSEEFYAAI